MQYVRTISLLGDPVDVIIHRGPPRNMIRFALNYDRTTNQYSMGFGIESHPIVLYNHYKRTRLVCKDESYVKLDVRDRAELRVLCEVLEDHRDFDQEIEMFIFGNYMVIISVDPMHKEYAMKVNMKTGTMRYIPLDDRLVKECKLVEQLTK